MNSYNSFNKLPNEFFEKICDLENELIIEEDVDCIEKLARLYKIGVEHYSSSNNDKKDFFLEKLQFLLNKYGHVFIEEKPKKQKTVNFYRRYSNALKFEMSNNTDTEKIIKMLSECEHKFNKGIKMINQDIENQQKSYIMIKNKKKSKMNLLFEVVSIYI